MVGLLASKAPAPTVQPPAVMPTPDDAAVLAAKKRQAAAIMQRSGRASTMLSDYSDGSNKLGS